MKKMKKMKNMKKTFRFLNIFWFGPGQAMALVRKSKRKPCLSWPAAPSSAEQSEQHPDSQARQAAGPGHVQIP